MQRGGPPRHISEILPGTVEAIRQRQRLARLLAEFGENEAELQARLAAGLASQGLEVWREVKSECGKCRIDLIVWEMTTGFKAGVEVKLVGRKRGKDLGDHLRQTLRYSKALFPFPGNRANPEPLDIYVFPQWSGLCLDEGELMHHHHILGHRADNGPSHNVCTFLGSFGIGELQLYERSRWQVKTRPGRSVGLRFAMKGTVPWSTDKCDALTPTTNGASTGPNG